MFRVVTSNGERYVLRLSRPGVHTAQEIRSELWWLQALHRDTDLRVPRPVAARDGELLVTVRASGVPSPCHCALFTWASGRAPLRTPSRSVARNMGMALASMHLHTDGLLLPPWFSRQRMDTVWNIGMPDALQSDAPHPALQPRLRGMALRRMDEAQSALNGLYADPSGVRLCHFDLHLANVKVQGDQLHILDFDDCAWSFAIQDISVSLYGFHARSRDPAALSEAFLEGYASLRSMPDHFEELIDILIDIRVADGLSYWLDDENRHSPSRAAAGLEQAERLLRRRRWGAR
jgi:Ser/Thr protein kinase RdoA (MazF antagonist)